MENEREERREITAEQLYSELCSEIKGKRGHVEFCLAGLKVKIVSTDIVGNCLQSWLKGWMDHRGIYSAEPENTQEFPDFFLSSTTPNNRMLEVKAFDFQKSPAFDIANFDSYLQLVCEKPYRLQADYLIFGYLMNEGEIEIKEIWLKKIWQIAGNSAVYPLKVQRKKGVIYNIRPNCRFKRGKKTPFKSQVEFLKALYETHKTYHSAEEADQWKRTLCENYRAYYFQELNF